MGGKMQNVVKEEKEKLKSKIKAFLEKNGINFKESKAEIEIKGKIKSIEITPYAKILFQLQDNKRLVIKDMINTIEIYSKTRIEISKSNLLLIDFKIYFENNKLVFVF